MEIGWKILFRIAGSLALLLHMAGLALACPEHLVCGNFTAFDKIQDCKYVTTQSLNEEDEQELLCTLWDQDYAYGGEIYQPPHYEPIQPDFSMEAADISNSSFILAWNMFIFGLFNYFVFSALTKSYIMRKWLSH